MLSAPTKMVFLASVLLAILSIIGRFAGIAVLSPFAYWLMLAAFVVLVVGVVMKGV